MTSLTEGIQRNVFPTVVPEQGLQPQIPQDTDQDLQKKIQLLTQLMPLLSIDTEPTLEGRKISARFPTQETPVYFTKNELDHILAHKKYVRARQCPAEIDSIDMSKPRTLFFQAFGKCISEIIEPVSQNDLPIVEIGSSTGYELSKKIIQKLIRTQPSHYECFLLNQTISDPIYRISLQDLCETLQGKGKKAPLFFGLNVFDTMSQGERKKCFSQIAKLQAPGNKLVLILDENPEFSATLKSLEAMNPGTVAVPFLPCSTIPAKLSFVLIPSSYIKGKLTGIDVATMIQEDAEALYMKKRPSQRQLWLHALQQYLEMKVVALEDFYAEQVTKELAEAGYTSTVYYHIAFQSWTLPKDMKVKGDLVYLPVTETIAFKSWEVDNPFLKNWLQSKDLKIPPQFTPEFVSYLRQNGQRILAAEALVIEATKN